MESKLKTPRNPRRKKAVQRTRKPKREKPLPPPLDPYVETAKELGLPLLTTPGSDHAKRAHLTGIPTLVSQEESSGGLLSGIKDLFSAQPSQPPVVSPQVGESPSSTSSIPRSEELSPESERILASVPKHIGDGGAEGTPGAEASDPGQSDEDALAGLVGGEIVDADDVQILIEMVGGFLADWRKREAYRVTGPVAGIAAKPWAQVINHLWVTYAPQMLTQLSDSVPGLTKAVMMTAIMWGPAVMADVKQTREERAERLKVEAPNQPRPQAVPPPARDARSAVMDSWPGQPKPEGA